MERVIRESSRRERVAAVRRFLALFLALAATGHGFGTGSSDEQQALSHSVDVTVEDQAFQLDVTWATGSYFASFMPPEAAERWQPERGVVLVVEEGTHSGSLPDTPLAADLPLEIGAERFLPDALETIDVHPHHRVSVVRYATFPPADGVMSVHLPDGQVISWPASAGWAPTDAGAAALAALGQEIYATAAGVGCAMCHGVDGRGTSGPDIRGRDVAAVRGAVRNVPDMSFMAMTDEEIDALVAYLAALAAAAE